MLQLRPRILPLLCLPAFVLLTAGSNPPQEPQIGEIGSSVSEFSLETWDGDTFTTADLKDRVTLLAFWYPT